MMPGLTLAVVILLQVQFLLTNMQKSLKPLEHMDLLRFLEQVLRLSVPNVANWLALFYLFFHLWLNILAEVLRFGDRVFYKVLGAELHCCGGGGSL